MRLGFPRVCIRSSFGDVERIVEADYLADFELALLSEEKRALHLHFYSIVALCVAEITF